MKKILILLGIIGLFLVGSMNGVKALEDSIESTSFVSSEIISSEDVTSSIISSEEDTNPIDDIRESELAKLLEEEIMKYIMYGGSASGGAMLVVGIVWYFFKKWLNHKIAKTDNSTNQIIESNNATQTLASALIEKASNYIESSYNESEKLTSKVNDLMDENKALIEENKKLQGKLDNIEKSIEIIATSNPTYIKNGVAEQVVNTLNKTSEKV